MMMAFHGSIGKENSNMAEAKATLFNLKWCKNNSLNHIILECASLMVVNMLKKKINVPWFMQNHKGDDGVDQSRKLYDSTLLQRIESSTRMHKLNGALEDKTKSCLLQMICRLLLKDLILWISYKWLLFNTFTGGTNLL